KWPERVVPGQPTCSPSRSGDHRSTADRRSARGVGGLGSGRSPTVAAPGTAAGGPYPHRVPGVRLHDGRTGAGDPAGDGPSTCVESEGDTSAGLRGGGTMNDVRDTIERITAGLEPASGLNELSTRRNRSRARRRFIAGTLALT